MIIFVKLQTDTANTFLGETEVKIGGSSSRNKQSAKKTALNIVIALFVAAP